MKGYDTTVFFVFRISGNRLFRVNGKLGVRFEVRGSSIFQMDVFESGTWMMLG